MTYFEWNVVFLNLCGDKLLKALQNRRLALRCLNTTTARIVSVKAMLAKYSSYSMRKMETLEEEFKLCSKQKEDAMNVQSLVVM